MKRPDHLPRCEADLDEWSVYADALLVSGDPLGEWIARDLALSPAPTDEERALLAGVGRTDRV